MGLRSKANQEIPVGSIWWTYNSTAPPGWLLCDGGSTTGYAALAAVVGTNVPDMRSRVPIGVGTGTGLTARALGTQYGSETVMLLTANMPAHGHGGGSHTHGMAYHTHTGGLHGHNGNSHTHGMSHDHGPHAHQGTVEVGNSSYAHTHNTVAGEVSSVTGGGGAYFTGVYMTFDNAAGYASFGSGATNSHSNEAPETGGPNSGGNSGTASATPATAQGSSLTLALGHPSLALTAIIKV